MSGGGGGGGGGSSKKKKKPAKPDPSFAEYASIPVVTTMKPFNDNNQALLAQQLAAGYGGGVGPYMQQMDNVYRPAQMVGLLEPLEETKAALSKGYNLNGTTGLLSLDRVLNIKRRKAGGGSSGGGSSSNSNKSSKPKYPGIGADFGAGRGR